MNKRGMSMAIELLIFVLLGLIVAGVVIEMFANVGKGSEETLVGLQKCEGVGAFVAQSGTYDNGKDDKFALCFQQKSCNGYVEGNKESKTAVAAQTVIPMVVPAGFRYQYIGEGFGCKTPTPFCCIKMAKDADPLRGTQVNALRCQSLAEGTWGYQSSAGGGDCLPLKTGDVIPVSVTTKLTFMYKPKTTDTECSDSVEDDPDCFGNSVNGINRFSSYSPADLYREYRAISSSSADLTDLNTPTKDMSVTLTSTTGGKTQFTLRVSNPPGANKQYFCSFADTGACANGKTPILAANTNDPTAFTKALKDSAPKAQNGDRLCIFDTATDSCKTFSVKDYYCNTGDAFCIGKRTDYAFETGISCPAPADKPCAYNSAVGCQKCKN